MARKTEPKSVLIVRFSALGDVAMTLPVVYDACRSHPGTLFVMLTRKLPAKLFINPIENLTVVGIDTAAYKGIGGIRQLFKELNRRYRFDCVVDLHDVIRTKILRLSARMAGIETVSVHKGRREKKALTRHSAKRVLPLMPMTDRYRDAFARAGLPAEPHFTALYPPHSADASLFADATTPRQPGERWLAIAPFAAHAGKVYPLPLMEKIVDHYARTGWKIFVFGAGEAEELAIESMAKDRPQVISMAKARIGIAGEIALMNHCDAMLAMDSANMHMASLAGLRTVSIWGATHPYAGFYGFRQDPADAVQLDMVCRPCSVFGNKPCKRGDYHCLNGISPALVISRIDSPAQPDKTSSQP